MTITLHWWMLPIALIIVGIVGMSRDKSTGMCGGLTGMLFLFGCIIAAVFVCIGYGISHFFRGT